MSEETPEQTQKKSFEDQLRELESIVELLENDMPPLEEALSAYESGINIARECLETLANAELRVQTLKLED